MYIRRCRIEMLLQSDWNDGAAVCDLVRSLGGAAPTTNQLSRDPDDWETNLEKGQYFSSLNY